MSANDHNLNYPPPRPQPQPQHQFTFRDILAIYSEISQYPDPSLALQEAKTIFENIILNFAKGLQLTITPTT